MADDQHESIHFVTGKLAESAVREIVERLADQHGFHYSIDVLPITVAALMTPKWLMRHLKIPQQATRVLLPGYLSPHLEEIASSLPIPVACGPKDVRDLPILFGKKRFRSEDYGEYKIEIIAEINYAPRLQRQTLIAEARRLIDAGANRIDLGCEPGSRWQEVGESVRTLVELGIAVSIDSFDP